MSGATTLDVYEDVLRAGRPVHVSYEGGGVQRHDVPRWLAAADPVDRRLLTGCSGPTLDLGCGPGRLAAALAAQGREALGVDASPLAVAMARARGAAAVCRDVFAPLPGGGLWSHALLVDGNIGIGGDPVRLLRRVGRLLAPGGSLLVEVSPHDVDRRGTARLHARDLDGHAFPWADVGARALIRVAAALGWPSSEAWTDDGRAFVALAERRLP